MTGSESAAPARAILNLGCGRKRLEGATNVDISEAANPDVVHDLNVVPWPFPDDSFDEIRAYDVLEHLRELLPVVEELSRIARDGAVVRITVPHFSSANAFTDPTHRRFFGAGSVDYFTDAHELSFYTAARFRVVTRSIVFEPTLLNKIVHRLANSRPERYESRWAWVFPAWFLYFELEVLKSARRS